MYVRITEVGLEPILKLVPMKAKILAAGLFFEFRFYLCILSFFAFHLPCSKARNPFFRNIYNIVSKKGKYYVWWTNLDSNRVIVIFPDKERRREPLYAIWNERKQRWYITKAKAKPEPEDRVYIRNVKEVLSARQFVNALESGRYFLP